MVGRLSREQCEQRLLTHGHERDFVVRQSKNPDLVRYFTLRRPATCDLKSIGLCDLSDLEILISYLLFGVL